MWKEDCDFQVCLCGLAGPFKPAKQICTFLVVVLHISAPNTAQTPEKGPRMEDSRLGDERDPSGYSILI